MGHDFVKYKDRHVRLHDFEIWMTRHFLIKTSQNKEFSVFIENIEWLGPGVFVGTELHSYVNDDQEKYKILISSLANAKKAMLKFGDYIPLEYLEKNVNLNSSYFTKKQPVIRYVQAVDSIISAVTE